MPVNRSALARAAGVSLILRARRHAALGEPVRLAMVDHLLLGDASPGELGDLVDLPTNLLAHHLKALDEGGLIRRVRSEGDRRRSYVQLCLDDPGVAAFLTGSAPWGPGIPGLPAGPGTGVSRVVFVCTHNSARSQLASAAWARVSPIPTASAGTHPVARVHPRAVAAGRRHGLCLAGAKPHPLADTIRAGDLLVAVCDNAHEELANTSAISAKIQRPPLIVGRGWLHWAIPDPVRVETEVAFETAYQHITTWVDRLAAVLDPTRTASSGDRHD